ncbi:hypothetical protein BS78_01G281600 [Paspalum vaginatum]|nr:hypothetical protein BS78_01G281600 [Paspalum vaginatum]
MPTCALLPAIYHLFFSCFFFHLFRTHGKRSGGTVGFGLCRDCPQATRPSVFGIWPVWKLAPWRVNSQNAGDSA